MKAIFLIGGPGSGKASVINELFSDYNYIELNSKQIKKEFENPSLVIVTENAYDIDTIISDKIIMESKGYDTHLIFVEISEHICEERASFLSEEVRMERFSNSKNNLEELKNIFESNFVFNNDIDVNHTGFISKQIRLDEVNSTKSFISSILEKTDPVQEKTITPKVIPTVKMSKFKQKVQEYCSGCQLTKTEFNPEKKSILYDEDKDDFYGKVTLTKTNNKSNSSNFEKDNNTKKSKNIKTSSITSPNTTGSGIGDQTALRYGGDSGSTFNMSGLGSVTYKESFRKKLKESIDSPSIGGDMGYIGGGWGQSNKDDYSDYGTKYATASGPKKQKTEENPCWKGYTNIGLKKKNGKMVPNCVPESAIKESVQFHIENSIPLVDSEFRICSESYFGLFNYIRENSELNILLSNEDKEILESDIGTFEWFEEESQFVPLDVPFIEDSLFENEEKTPPLNKPKRGGSKKFYVYVKTPEGNVKKVSFGDTTGLSVKFNNPERRRSFAARHNCSSKNDKTTPGYWSCRLPRYAKSLGLSGGGSGFW